MILLSNLPDITELQPYFLTSKFLYQYHSIDSQVPLLVRSLMKTRLSALGTKKTTPSFLALRKALHPYIKLLLCSLSLSTPQRSRASAKHEDGQLLSVSLRSWLNCRAQVSISFILWWPLLLFLRKITLWYLVLELCQATRLTQTALTRHSSYKRYIVSSINSPVL